MNKPVSLEDFDISSAATTLTGGRNATTDELAAIELASYESGYQAGWMDALKGVDEDQERIEAEFASNLEDLGFTFHEARSHVLGSLEPLLLTFVDTLLPEVVKSALGLVIQDEILPMAAQAADAPIEIRISPGSAPVLERLMEHVNAIPLEIVVDETLPDGQVFLRSSTAERCIDLSSALVRIKGAVTALYDIKEKAFEHG